MDDEKRWDIQGRERKEIDKPEKAIEGKSEASKERKKIEKEKNER